MASVRPLDKADWLRQKYNAEAARLFPASHGSDWRGLLVKPENVSFATQNENEVVYMLLRRHIITNSGWIFNAVTLSLLPIILHNLLVLFGIDVFQFVSLKLITLGALVFYSIILTSVVKNFIDWYFNLYIITNERVIDYDFKSFVSNGVTEANFVGIEDVKETTVGFLPNLFDYGTIAMFTEGDHNPITFHDVPDPTLVRDKVSDLAKIAKNILRE
jgi:hypothetical protein